MKGEKVDQREWERGVWWGGGGGERGRGRGRKGEGNEE